MNPLIFLGEILLLENVILLTFLGRHGKMNVLYDYLCCRKNVKLLQEARQILKKTELGEFAMLANEICQPHKLP